MGQVVRHSHELALPVHPREVVLEVADLQGGVVDFGPLPAVKLVLGVGVAVPAVVEAMGQVGQVAGDEAGVLQAGPDRSDGEGATGLLPVHPLLGHRDFNLAAADQGGGRIEPLGDAIGAAIEGGKARVLVGDRVVEPADTDDVHACVLLTGRLRRNR